MFEYMARCACTAFLAKLINSLEFTSTQQKNLLLVYPSIYHSIRVAFQLPHNRQFRDTCYHTLISSSPLVLFRLLHRGARSSNLFAAVLLHTLLINPNRLNTLPTRCPMPSPTLALQFMRQCHIQTEMYKVYCVTTLRAVSCTHGNGTLQRSAKRFLSSTVVLEAFETEVMHPLRNNQRHYK